MIDQVGKFTGHTSYRVNCTPTILLGSTISTIYRRVYALVVRRHGRTTKTRNRWSDLLARCSTYYALTKNAYFWDRLLALIRKGENRPVISSYLHRLTCKLDDYKWFVYSHACSQTKWLTFRAERPRDKSSYVREYFYRNRDTPVLAEDSRCSFEYDAIWYSALAVSTLCLR